MPLHRFTNGGQRTRIIRIRADEKINPGIPQARQIIVEHVLDDAVLFPCRHIDSHVARWSSRQILVAGGCSGDQKTNPCDSRGQNDHAVVETADDDPEGKRYEE